MRLSICISRCVQFYGAFTLNFQFNSHTQAGYARLEVESYNDRIVKYSGDCVN